MLPFLTAFFALIFSYYISYAFFYYFVQLCFIQIKIISILIKPIGCVKILATDSIYVIGVIRVINSSLKF